MSWARFAGCGLLTLAVLLGAAEPAAGPAVAVLADLPYRDGPGLDDYARQRCRLDLYLPPSGTAFPVMVWFHGGGLEGGEKASAATAAVAARFARDGIAVAAVEYRLSPVVTAPAYIEDAAAAVAWVAAHAGEHGGDPRSLFIAGHSAGGYLAALLGADAGYLAKAGLPADAIAGVIPVSGQTFTHFTIRKERGTPDPERTPVIDGYAPCFHVARAREMAPLLLICGDHDWVARAEENRYYLAMLTSCGARDARYLEIADRTHGSILGRMTEDGDPAAQAILAFIRGHRRPAP
jgi:acetyl esterase/lipase